LTVIVYIEPIPTCYTHIIAQNIVNYTLDTVEIRRRVNFTVLYSPVTVPIPQEEPTDTLLTQHRSQVPVITLGYGRVAQPIELADNWSYILYSCHKR
jgi:hypothetical protein